MVEAYSNDITVANGAFIPLNNIAISVGTCTPFTAGSTNIALNKSGIYKITVNATGYNTSATTSPIGLFSIQLYNNGVAIPYAISSEISTNSADVVSPCITTLVKINKSCCIVNNNGSISIKYLGDAGTITNISVIAERLQI